MSPLNGRPSYHGSEELSPSQFPSIQTGHRSHDAITNLSNEALIYILKDDIELSLHSSKSNLLLDCRTVERLIRHYDEDGELESGRQMLEGDIPQVLFTLLPLSTGTFRLLVELDSSLTL